MRCASIASRACTWSSSSALYFRSRAVPLPLQVYPHRGFTTRVPQQKRANTVKIPVIDISGFRADPRTPAEQMRADEICSAVHAAVRQHGFFHVVGHGLPHEVLNGMFAQMRAFFAQADEDKQELHVSKQEGFRGYSALFEQGGYDTDATDFRAETESESDMPSSSAASDANTSLDAKEVFHMGQELDRSHPHYDPVLFAPNVWPARDGGVFKAHATQYWDALMRVSDELIFEIFARSLRLPAGHFRPLADQGMNSCNMIHYPAVSQETRDQGQLGIGAHTDFECFTLLAQEDGGVAGLEILAADTGEWLTIEPEPHALLVNVGDLMARWSNDTFRSTVHRAVNHGTRDRYSIAFFRCCNYDVTLANLTAEPDKYPPVVAGEHMLKRINAANQPNADALFKDQQ